MQYDKDLMKVKVTPDEEIEIIESTMAHIELGYIDYTLPIDHIELSVLYQLLAKRRKYLRRKEM